MLLSQPGMAGTDASSSWDPPHDSPIAILERRLSERLDKLDAAIQNVDAAIQSVATSHGHRLSLDVHYERHEKLEEQVDQLPFAKSLLQNAFKDGHHQQLLQCRIIEPRAWTTWRPTSKW